MMKKVRGLGKGFFILSALLLMFAVVGCDDSDSTERIGADTDEETVAVGVNTENFTNIGVGQVLRVDAAIDGDAYTSFSARVAGGAGADVTIQTGDYDTAFSDEFDEAFDEDAGAGNKWQVAGFARMDTNATVSLDSITLTMPGWVVVGGRTLSDWVASGLKPTIRVYDSETDTWSTVDPADYTLVGNADGTVTFTYNGPAIEVNDGDIVAVMAAIDDVDVDLTATTPDNNCDVTVTARVDDSDYDVTDVMWWTISPLSWGDTTELTDDSLRLNGVVSGDDRVRVHVQANVYYSSGTNSDIQTVERIFSIRCETGSGGITF